MILNTLCPVCRKRVFGFWIKLAIGPAGAVACPSCGEHIGVSIWPHLAGVAAFIGYVLYGATDGSLMENGRFATVLLVSIVLAWGLWFLQAPLVKKDVGG